jgi:hypothetical protein
MMRDEAIRKAGSSNRELRDREHRVYPKDGELKDREAMSDERSQGRTRSDPGAGPRKACARYTAQCRALRRSIVVLIRSWVRDGVVASPNQVAAELNRRAVPQPRGKNGCQRIPSSRCFGRHKVRSPSSIILDGAI